MLPDTWLSTPFAWLLTAAVIFALLAVWAMIALVRAVRARRPLRAVNRLLLSLAFDLVAVAAAFLAVSMYGYGRLTAETPVARLGFQQTGPRVYLATLSLPDGRRLGVPLAGDEWQLDARVVKWKPYAVVAGLDPLYKLDRLSGRYRDLDDERTLARSIHDLDDNQGPDLWRLAERYPRWLPFVDTEYGSGAYLPMRDGAMYDVTLSPLGGLIARPVTPDGRDRDG